MDIITDIAMHRVFVFFAGATTLQDERNQIKALANDLNAKYQKKGIQIVIFTYEHLGDCQDTYDDFITSKADVAIFVFKDSTENITFEELEKAIAARNTLKKPKTIVFLHADNTNIEDKKRLTSILGKNNYFKNYKNSDDFKQQTKESLISIIEDNLDKINNNSAPKHFLGWLLAAVLIIIGTVYSIVGYKHSREPLLLFAGGGSVANYISDGLKVKLDSLDNAVCLRMGSTLSWSILAEEVNRTDESKKSNRYLPIVMSAAKANERIFTDVCPKNELVRYIAIMEYKLGKDSLAVYIDSAWFNSIKHRIDLTHRGNLSKKGFSTLFQIALETGNVFATSPGSGTRRHYREFLPEDLQDSIYSKRINLFHENHASIGGSARCFLSSDFYPPKKDLDVANMVKLYIEDSIGQVLAKDLYLYFPAYRSTAIGKQTTCTIPPSIITFLEQIGADNNLKDWDSIKDGHKKCHPDSIVFSL